MPPPSLYFAKLTVCWDPFDNDLIMIWAEVRTLETFDHILNRNVRSVFELSRLAILHLIQTTESIVNVSNKYCGLRRSDLPSNVNVPGHHTRYVTY